MYIDFLALQLLRYKNMMVRRAKHFIDLKIQLCWAMGVGYFLFQCIAFDVLNLADNSKNSIERPHFNANKMVMNVNIKTETLLHVLHTTQSLYYFFFTSTGCFRCRLVAHTCRRRPTHVQVLSIKFYTSLRARIEYIPAKNQ